MFCSFNKRKTERNFFYPIFKQIYALILPKRTILVIILTK